MTGNEDITNEQTEKQEKEGRVTVSPTSQGPVGDTPTDTQETDPSLAETTRYLNNFREEEAARKSKIAEMAEANESGKGVMFGGDKT